MRPLFSVVLMPSTPMNEDRLATAGILEHRRCASACWRSAIAANEIDCGASGDALDHARVLHREEALGDEDVQQHGERERARRATHSVARLAGRAPSRASRRSARSRASKQRAARAVERSPARSGGVWRRSFAHIIGVSVSDTTAEIRIATASVIANSRNSRPTTSPMNSSGISTAISENVSEMIVKPICSRPSARASSGGSPSSM